MAKKVYIISMIIFIIDQITKCIVSSYLKLNQSLTLINDYLYIKYINNTGASWGILPNSRLLLIILSIIAIIIIIRYINTFKKTKLNTIGFGFLIGGIIGNLCDRLIFGYVRDFIDMIIFHYDFPIFNMADIFIVLGVILLIISIVRGEDSCGVKSR